MFMGLITMGLVAVAFVLGLYVLHRILAVVTDPLVVLPYQSGHRPEEHALSRYHVRWYLASLVFLGFDVEMLFMYPWAVVVGQVGASAVIEMFVFLVALFAAVLWAWREGALRWA